MTVLISSVRFVTSHAHTTRTQIRSARFCTVADCCFCCLHSCSCRTANCADAANAQRQRILHAVRFEGPLLTTSILRRALRHVCLEKRARATFAAAPANDKLVPCEPF